MHWRALPFTLGARPYICAAFDSIAIRPLTIFLQTGDVGAIRAIREQEDTGIQLDRADRNDDYVLR